MKKFHETSKSFSDDYFTEKISIEQLRSIWNDENHTCKDEELYRIRDWLYAMHEIIDEVIEEQRNNGTLPDLTIEK